MLKLYENKAKIVKIFIIYFYLFSLFCLVKKDWRLK